MMNKEKSSFFLFLALCLPFFLSAQTIKMIRSTRQSWSGGIAGRSGANYTFVVEFSDYTGEPVPDTLWISDEPFNLIVSDSTIDYGNTTRTRSKKGVQYAFNAEIVRDEDPGRYGPGDEQNTPPAHPPIAYKGVALLSYKYKGKEHYYTISRIMTNYPPADYP